MDIKKNFNAVVNFFLNKKDKLLKPDSVDIIFISNDVAIGIAQSLSWKHDGKLWIPRARFDKEKISDLFKNASISKSCQLKPFDIVIRASNLSEIILHDLSIVQSNATYNASGWLIGEDIYLSLPKKVSINDSTQT